MLKEKHKTANIEKYNMTKRNNVSSVRNTMNYSSIRMSVIYDLYDNVFKFRGMIPMKKVYCTFIENFVNLIKLQTTYLKTKRL